MIGRTNSFSELKVSFPTRRRGKFVPNLGVVNNDKNLKIQNEIGATTLSFD